MIFWWPRGWAPRARDRPRPPARARHRPVRAGRGEPPSVWVVIGALRPARARRRAPWAGGVICPPRCCRRLRVAGSSASGCAGGDPNAHRARTHGVMCRAHAARALSHTQRAHGGCFVHAPLCTLWQVLTTDATFVANPARLLGAHSAPAVVRCARCVSPPHRALPHLQCELCAPHEPLCWWWSFVTRRPASLAAAPARTTTRPRARPSVW